MQEMWVCGFHPWERSLGEDPLATHSNILAWEIPGTGAWKATVQRVAKSQTRLRLNHHHHHHHQGLLEAVQWIFTGTVKGGATLTEPPEDLVG